MPKITFVKEKKEIEVPAGANLRQAALDAGIAVHHHPVKMPDAFSKIANCHGFAMCGTCHVHVKKGMENCSPRGSMESTRLACSAFAIGHENEVRLSCQTRVEGDVEVETQPPMNLFGERFW